MESGPYAMTAPNPYRQRQEARRAYRRNSEPEDRAERAASPDYLDEAFGDQLGEDRFDQFD